MAKMVNNPVSFLGGFVQNPNTIRVACQVDELKDAGSTHSRLNKLVLSEGKWFSFRLEWQAIKIIVLTSPELHVIATGPAGIVSVSTIAGVHEEEIDPSLDGPSRRGDISDMRVIGDHVYVCGMSRMVYRREGRDRWTRQDEGVVKPRGSFDLVGFNAIDGVSESDILAVGFGGEIWRRKNGSWKQVDSPTNVVLHALRVVSPDLAFACGQKGTLLRSRGDHWEVIDQGLTTQDFWGLEWFRDRLYVATTGGLFMLNEQDDLEKVDLHLKGEFTFSHLHQNDGVLLSVGPKHVLYTEDGITWIDTKA